jgi:SLT domain-containing protein
MGYADGGRVTRPQLAIVGEKEPETIIPDSKLGSIGNTINYITVNVDGYNIKNDEEFIELLSRKFSELSVRQQRAVGGAGW